MQALKDNDIDVIGKKMTIAGAGGAATAIEIQAALDGVKKSQSSTSMTSSGQTLRRQLERSTRRQTARQLFTTLMTRRS